MKKICIVLPPFMKYPNKNGCAVETLVNVIGEKNNFYNKINLTILSLKKDGIGNIKLNIFDNIFNFIYRCIKKVFKKQFFPFNKYYYKVLKNIVKNKYDYIIFEAGDLNMFECISKKVGQEKMIYHIHHDIESESESNKKIILNSFNYYIGVSNFVLQRIAKYKNNINKLFLLKNCTNDSSYEKMDFYTRSNLRSKYNLLDDDFVILFVGRLIEEKGILELINVIKSISNVKLLILGSNFSENISETDFTLKLKKSIRGFEDKIHFTGYIPHNDIYKFYQIADLQVIPSICEEAAGLVAIEGMMCGLPIIATASGGLVEYIDNSCSMVIEKNNNLEKNLKNSIINLYKDKTLCNKMGECGVKKSKEFSEEKYYNDFLKIIDSLE